MTNKKRLLALLCVMAGGLMAQGAKVTQLPSNDLPEFPGKEVSMVTVEYAPGNVDPIHRHNARAFVYVLEGTILMELGGRCGR